ncbi:MAG: coenzyme F420-0:L-glutamate ligase [Candidatus Paceibacterota bacterium]
MKVMTIKTPVVKPGENLEQFLVAQIRELPEKSILVITSKIISFAQNRLAPVKANDRDEKHALARQEADLYLDPAKSKYDIMLTIKDSILAVNAGIDQSNADGQYVLWPENLQQTVNQLWQFLRQHFQVNQLGVIVTDSKTMPLRWGVTGTAIAHCGFQALINKIGTPDIFGKQLEMTQINVMEAVAIAAVFEMGEGNEQQPLAIVSEISQPIEFQDRPPTEEELASLIIDPADDVYAPVLMSADWQKGGGQHD